MKLIILIVFLTLILSCEKEEEIVPLCKFTIFSSNGNTKNPVTYRDTVAIFSDGYGYTLYFNKEGRLLRKEAPLLNPYQRYDLVYNNSGQVIEKRYYNKHGGNDWVYDGKQVFVYEREKMVSVGQPGVGENFQIIWQGNNIKSVVYRMDEQVQCTVMFTYDGNILNPNGQFNYFYFVDNNTNDVNYKLPYYFSQHLPTKQETNCWAEEPKNFTYTFTPNGLIESVTIQQGIGSGSVWEYEYECR